ncbi:hypothetical protein JCM8208_005819 [Rhodotorula glutinis]
MDIALDPVADLLLGHVKSLYYWLQQRPQRGTALGDDSRAHDHNINTSLGGAGTRFADNWHVLLPWERERVVDRLLAAYCVTRTPHEDFVWTKLNYQHLRRAAGFKDIPKESVLAVMDTQAAPYIQVSNLVRAIRNLCIDSRRTDALNSCTRWEASFLGRVGIMRGKLYRLERAVQERVVQEVHDIFVRVLERLQTGHAIADVLLTADAVLSRAHDSLEHASTRFSTFVSFLDDLVTLYSAFPSHEQDVAALRVIRQSFEERMTIAEVPTVVERRTAEVHFSMLPVDQQVQAVARGRALLYYACRETHAVRGLPDVQQVRAELLNALEHPQLMRLVRDARTLQGQQRH